LRTSSAGSSGDIVQRLRRDISAVWPGNGSAAHKEPLKVLRIPERLEHRTDEPLPEIDRVSRSVVECDANPVIAVVLRVDDERHLGQWFPFLERRNRFQGLTRLHVLPVCQKFSAMLQCPLPDSLTGLARFCHKELTVNVNFARWLRYSAWKCRDPDRTCG
jgi:hypothetical protein